MGTKGDIPKAYQLPQKTLTTILHCLQVCVGTVSQDCAEAILAMVQNCSLMLSKDTLSRLPPTVLRHRGFVDNIKPVLSTTGKFYTAAKIDSLSSLNSSLTSMNISPSLSTASKPAFLPIDTYQLTKMLLET